MEQHEIIKLFAEVSILGAIVWLFIQFTLARMKAQDTHSQEREERISGRVTRLEQFIETTLMELIKNTSGALAANTEALNRTYTALEKAEEMAIRSHTATLELINRMDRNPCLLGDRDNQTKKIADDIAAQMKAAK